MRLVEINWSPTKRQLLQFGFLCLVLFPGMTWFAGASNLAFYLAAGLGLSIAVLSVLLPRAVKPLFLGAMLVAAPIGMVIGEIAMLCIYYCVFLPIALVFRGMRRDALQRRIDTTVDSYWSAKTEPTEVESYYRRY